MLKRLLTQKRYFKNIYKKQKGITGLETAIILIAFVVVAAVFAYTVLSAGLFSTQKSQEAVYAGLEETQNTIDLKGAVVANGSAMLNNCDYDGWTAHANVTMARETTQKWEGSGSLKCDITVASAANDVLLLHALPAMDLTAGDTLAFWIKEDAANLSGDMTFAISPNANLTAATETYVITTSGTNWEKHTFDLTSATDDDPARYFGIILTTDDAAAYTFYLDNVMFEDVAAQNGIPCGLDSCDYPAGWTHTGTIVDTITRDTADKVEGTGALDCHVLDAADVNNTLIAHEMVAKEFVPGDTVTFWVKADNALRDSLVFAFATGPDLQGTATEIQAISQPDTDVAWHKYTMTLTTNIADPLTYDTSAVYYGIYMDAAVAGAFNFRIDDIEFSNASLNNNNDPMNAFGNSISFTVALASGGDGVDFTTTTDSDKDGMLSDEASKTHKVVIYYNDETQQLTDLAWTMNPIGKADSDSILDVGEKFEITVDLTYVNQNSGVWASSKIGKNKTFTIELKPPTGAVLTIQRTMPPKVLTVNNLN